MAEMYWAGDNSWRVAIYNALSHQDAFSDILIDLKQKNCPHPNMVRLHMDGETYHYDVGLSVINVPEDLVSMPVLPIWN